MIFVRLMAFCVSEASSYCFTNLLTGNVVALGRAGQIPGDSFEISSAGRLFPFPIEISRDRALFPAMLEMFNDVF
jgi:hypothetical protein